MCDHCYLTPVHRTVVLERRVTVLAERIAKLEERLTAVDRAKPFYSYTLNPSVTVPFPGTATITYAAPVVPAVPFTGTPTNLMYRPTLAT